MFLSILRNGIQNPYKGLLAFLLMIISILSNGRQLFLKSLPAFHRWSSASSQMSVSIPTNLRQHSHNGRQHSQNWASASLQIGITIHNIGCHHHHKWSPASSKILSSFSLIYFIITNYIRIFTNERQHLTDCHQYPDKWLSASSQIVSASYQIVVDILTNALQHFSQLVVSLLLIVISSLRNTHMHLHRWLTASS